MKGGRRSLVPYAYLSPALLTILVLSILPMIYTVYISFTNFDLDHFDHPAFVGLSNYREILFGDYFKVFGPVFVWTVVYAVLTTLGSYLIGLYLALLLTNPNLKETNLYRAILIIPWALPGTIAILAWQGLLNPSYGQLNTLLQAIGLHRIDWTNDPTWARVAIIMVSMWLSYPFQMNVCLGALTSIPKDLYEAADMDGAGLFRKFFSVTFPGLMGASLPLLISSFSFNFNNFGPAFLINYGGPPRADTQFAGYTDILISTVYNLTLNFNKYQIASAFSLLMFLVIGTLSYFNFKWTRAFKEA